MVLPPPDWIDAHCHLADLRIQGDLSKIIERSQAAHVGGWIQGGVSPEDWDRQIEIQARFGSGVVVAFGLHPWWVAEQSRENIEKALQDLEQRGVQARAIGELGLDLSPRHVDPGSLERQVFAFEKQLEIAKNLGKPLILHIVKAHQEALSCLKRWAPFPRSGIVHSFSGSSEVAREYLALGFSLSIGGAITRRGFQTLKKAVRWLPLEKLVVETDSPDQPPELPGVGILSLNEPAYLVQIAEALSHYRKESPEEILGQSAKNIKNLFG